MSLYNMSEKPNRHGLFKINFENIYNVYGVVARIKMLLMEKTEKELSIWFTFLYLDDKIFHLVKFSITQEIPEQKILEKQAY